jgi:hypothetical protein
MRTIASLALSLLLAQVALCQERGGSNFAWYRLGPDCEGDPYGVIANYAGLRRPWIIGEVFCNDAQEAQVLRQKIDSTGKRVLFLLEWPLDRSSACRDVSVAAPLDFGEYMARGF